MAKTTKNAGKKVTTVHTHPRHVKPSLKNPKDISIPMAVRWLAYKKVRAEAKLGRPATHEDIILEYKGILKSKTDYKNKALKIYRNYYDLLKK